MDQSLLIMKKASITATIDDAELAEEILARLADSLQSQTVAAVYNHLCILDSMKAEGNAVFKCVADCEGSKTIEEARGLIHSWRSELKEGDYVDKFSAIDAVCSQSSSGHFTL